MKALFLFMTLLLTLNARADEPRTVPSVDLQRYLGLWYEIASIPQDFQKQCVGNTTAEYSTAENSLIKVVNSCDTQNGSRSVAEGRARVEDPQSNAKLRVTFVKIIDWVFTFGGNYWIIDLAPDYSFAVVGDPTRDYAWILSRQSSMDRATLVGIELRLREQGYDTTKILTSVQSGGYGTRIPLSDVVK